MSKLLDKKEFKNFSEIFNKNISLENQVATLVSRLRQQHFRPHLSELFNYVKQEENLLVSSYNSISDDIRLSITKLMDDMNDKKLEHLKIELEISGLESNYEEYKNLYSKVLMDTNQEKSDEYMKFLNLYETMNKLSVDVINLKQELEKLLNLQTMLDNIFASEIIEVEYLAGKLDLLINNFGSFKTRPLLNAYLLKFSRKTELEKLILGKEAAFKEKYSVIKGNLNNESVILDKSKLVDSGIVNSLKSKQVTKDIFIAEK